MRPTTAGAAILASSRRLLEVESEIKVAATAELEVGELRLGVIHSVLTGIIPDLLALLKVERPGIKLQMLPGMSSGLYNDVLEDRLDAAIIVEPPIAVPKALDWALLRSEPLLMITPQSVSSNDIRKILQSEPFIRYDRLHWGGRIVDQYMRTMRFKPRDDFELDSLEAIAILVSRGLGVSIVPDWLPPWPAGVTVRRLNIPNAPTRNLGMLWSRGSTSLPLIKGFLSQATGLCRSGGFGRPVGSSLGSSGE